jgi:hypothetical protein
MLTNRKRLAWGGAFALLIALGIAGCTAAPSEESSSTEPAAGTESAAPLADDVQKAVTIANEIDASPDRAAEILAAHGMTQDEFQALMYEIAQDPAKSEAYAQARGAGNS